MGQSSGSGSFIVGLCIAVAVSVFGIGCGTSDPVGGVIVGETPYGPPAIAGQIETNDVKESSGLAASECQDVLWTHNDAGDDAFIFAMDLQGKHLGTWKVQGAQNVDWESIASSKDGAGKCSLLIGDIGDNEESRPNITIYRIAEPAMSPDGASSSTERPLQTAVAEALSVTYANGARNAEALLVHPKTRDIYIVTKTKSGPAEVHKLRTPAFGTNSPQKTEKIGEISLPGKQSGLITDGAMSSDGTRVMLCNKDSGFEFVLPAGSPDPDSIWKQAPIVVDIGDRKQGEGVTYSRDGSSLYASSEKKNTPLYLIRRK